MKMHSITFFSRINPAFTIFGYLLLVLGLSIFTESAVAQNGVISEVVVYQEYIPDEKLQTAEISDVIDADAMGITGDSNVGEALKRLPGLSLVGGKFIYIRGLGDRYSSTYYNGAPMPGLEPLTRAVPLDLFDSSVISNLLVQKTYSPDYSSEFTGGIVDIRSAAIPDENGFDIKIKTGSNSESTGEERLTYHGGDRDRFGYDDGTRALPGLVKPFASNPDLFSAQDGLTALQRDQLVMSFSEQNNVWDIVRDGDNPLDTGLSAAFKRRWDEHSRISVGLIATFSYDHKWRNRYEDRRRWALNRAASNSDISTIESFGGEDIVADTVLDFGDDDVLSGPLTGESGIQSKAGLSNVGTFRRTQRQVGLNGLISLGLDIDGIHEIKLTKMLLRKTTDEASITSQGFESSGIYRVVDRTRLLFEENEIDFTQLSGTHSLDSATISWRYSDIGGERDVPDERTFGRYTAPALISRPTQVLGFNRFTDRVLNPQRTYTNVIDNTDDIGFDLTLPFTSDLLDSFDVKLGYSRTQKQRKYDAFRVTYQLTSILSDDFEDLFATDEEFIEFSQQDLSVLTDASGCVAGGINAIDDNCYLHLSNSPNTDEAIDVKSGFSAPNSEYDGTVLSEATYMVFDINVSAAFRLNLGLRRESYELAASVPANPRNSNSVELSPELSSKGTYPSATFTWNFAENMALRGAYSETQNRPNLNEFIPVQVINTQDGRTYEGNQRLIIADITSNDLRYEWYFGDRDYLSITAFKKQIDNPIETRNNDQEGLPLSTWVNHDEAVNEGYEFEIRKYFGGYFSVIANATKIDSSLTELRRDGNYEIIETIKDSRPLQGVSKELYNAQLIYQDDAMSVSLAWNYFSKRISTIVGQDNSELIVFEQPRDTVDFNWKYNILLRDSELGIAFKASNILDEEFLEPYESGLVYDRYKAGRSYGLSLSWKL